MSRRRGDLLSLGTFIMLGLPDGALGTAWPDIRHSFGAPVGALGLILLVNTLGSMAVAPVVGRMMRALGVAVPLALAGTAAAVAALAYAAAPGLWLLFLIGPLVGVGAGLTDGVINTAIALSGRTRLLNLLHGFYGIGTALGPLLVTLVVALGAWRAAYATLAAFDLAGVGLWLGLRVDLGYRAVGADAGSADRDAGEAAAAAANAAGSDPGAGGTVGADRARWSAWPRRRERAALGFGLAVFFVYAGLEVSAGQWETSYGRGHLGLSATTAGLATFGYWGMLTLMRLTLALGRSVAPVRVVRWGVGASLAGALIIWAAPDAAVAVIGFLLLGAANAGIFPALVALTPRRLGPDRAHHAIAWQVGAAAAGGSGASAVIGGLITAAGLVVLGPALVALTLILALASWGLDRVAPVRG